MAFTPEQSERIAQNPPGAEISTRQGGGNAQLSYLKPSYVVETANAIFGYGAWAFEVIGEPHLDPGGKAYLAVGRLHIAGLIHPITEVGTVPLRNDLADEVDKAYKGAATDAMKRCFARIGPAFGSDMAEASASAKAAARPATTTRTATASRAEEAVNCATCQQPVRGYTAENGAVVTQSTLLQASRKSFEKALCRSCFAKARQGTEAKA